MRRTHLIFALVLWFGCFAFATAAQAAPRVDPQLSARLNAAQPGDMFGVILTFDGAPAGGPSDAQVAAVSALGVKNGVRMQNFPILGVNATPAQIRQMMAWGDLKSIYLNSPLELYLHQTKPLLGVTRLQSDSTLTRRNAGFPVSGRGVTVAINDSGIDGAHPDLKFNPLDPASKTVQNVLVNPNDQDGLVVRLDALGNVVEGILPPAYVENVINTDTHVGHGTHVAGIVAGTGQASGGKYAGVAPGARLLGLGSGGVLFVLGQIAAFDYALTHQFQYNVRVVNNSWGNSAVAVDPEHPINQASKRLYERNIVVVFANGNDGPDQNSQNRWASVPWVISAGASQKDGRIASFSSRGVFGDSQIRPSVLTPGTGGPAEGGFTSAVIAARSATNVVANGADADTEIPPAFLPYYTQISGTSMAAPHLAGVVACMLEANPALTPDEVKAIIERTATQLAPYDEYEAGAGLANVHAAVDAAYNPNKAYGQFGFSGKGLALEPTGENVVSKTLPARGSQDTPLEVAPNTRFAFVQLDWGAAAGESAVIVDNTKLVAPDLVLTVLRDGVQVARSNATNLGGLFGAREAVKLEFPAPGTYTVRVSAGLNGAGAPVDQPYQLTFTGYAFDPNQIADLGALDESLRTKALRLIYDRVLFADGGSLRANDSLTRMELGRALMFGARVPQFIPNAPTFTDVAAGTPDALVVESLRRENVIGLSSGSTYGPGVAVSRLELAVALVRALRLDNEARNLVTASFTVTAVNSQGQRQPITDNAKIPATLRGYVQIALDRGLLQAFPAEVRETAPGQFQVLPGPRFEPGTVVTRGDFVEPASRLLSQMYGE